MAIITNKPSQRIMQKFGLQLDHYFEHPEIPESNPLKPHVCYRVAKYGSVGFCCDVDKRFSVHNLSNYVKKQNKSA